MGDDLSPLALGLRWPCSWRSQAFPQRPCNAWASDRRMVRPLREYLHHAEHHRQIPPQVSAPDGTRSRWSTAARNWTLYTPVTQTNTKTLTYDLLLNLLTHSITHFIHSSTHPLITVSYNLFSPVSNSYCSFIWSVSSLLFPFISLCRQKEHLEKSVCWWHITTVIAGLRHSCSKKNTHHHNYICRPRTQPLHLVLLHVQ